ncbi:MAG: hypothetical protein PHO10_00260 [Gemmiger sp.]|nr:hypothetical protein [Gemmiger sp.]
MDHYHYGENRWKIICGEATGPEQRAVEWVYSLLAQYVPYILVCEKAQAGPDTGDYNLILMGTYASNPILAKVVDESEIPEQGYLVRVGQSPFAANKQVVILAGKEPAAVYYAASEWMNCYLPAAHLTGGHEPYFQALWENPLRPYEHATSPACRVRGIWTWGHCIYNIENFAKTMAGLRLNEVTLWNDYAPLNLAQAVECFHSYGIRVILGYSWGWGETVNVASEEELTHWKQRAAQIYATEYADVKADGIYTQLFTETTEDTLCGVPIADAVVHWVNTISEELQNQNPGLYIQFGLHATSVKNRLAPLQQVRPNVDIIWEDCGAFPYAYLPGETDGLKETLQLTDAVCALRPGCGCGAILKGQICLNWSRFEHQKGPFIMGCRSAESQKKCFQQVKELWRYVQSEWIQNGEACREVIARFAAQDGKLYALVEDGLLEAGAWLPTALYAQMLWQPGRPFSEQLAAVCRRADVIFG